MGTGKTSASISYMNEHKTDKFIYITPYLDEAARIKNGCPDIEFIEPSNKIKECGFSKTKHTIELLKKGKNVTTTHQAFKYYTEETIKYIKEGGYTLMIDENVDILEKSDCTTDDLQLLINSGYIKCNNGLYTLTDKKYSGSLMSEVFRLLESRELIRLDNKGRELYYWSLPQTFITSFKNVYILTYLFEGQSLHHFLKIYNIPYQYIGIEKNGERDYRFGDFPGYIPEYTSKLKDMLHILDNEKLNEIGDSYYSMSMNWFDDNTDGVIRLKKNVYNYFNNIMKETPAGERMWGSHKSSYSKLKGKGYTKGFVTFNTKATNAYRNRTCLVYVANIFMNVNEKSFYNMCGIEVDEDMYALSIMVQWIWRSAIRDGDEVCLYIPSKRMRAILMNWIEITSQGGDMIE